MMFIAIITTTFIWSASLDDAEPTDYSWINSPVVETLYNSYQPPTGYKRQTIAQNSFASWVQKLPLSDKNAKVLKYDGQPLWYQRHADRIIEMDVGNKDLMQCADFLIRLKAEYAYSINNTDKLAFHFTSGDLFSFKSWLLGIRPVVSGNAVKWRKTKKTQLTHAALNDYLQIIYMYAGTVSLMTETKPVKALKDIQIGDILLEAGFPGHTMMVADLAVNDTGDIRALFIEGSTPAQSPHVVTSTMLFDQEVWIPIKEGHDIETSIWTFKPEHLRRFKK